MAADEIKQMIQIQKEFLALPIDKVIPENNPLGEIYRRKGGFVEWLTKKTS